MNNTKKMVTCAMLIAVATVLSRIIIWQWPEGGAITAGSMVPIIIIPYLFGLRYGLISGLVYACLQMLFGIPAPPTTNFLNWALVASLDYILAFTILGIGRFFSKNIIIGSIIVIFLRLICHFFSGIIVWGAFAPVGQPIWAYSAIYNAQYMIPEMLITAVVVAILAKLPQIPWAREK